MERGGGGWGGWEVGGGGGRWDGGVGEEGGEGGCAAALRSLSGKSLIQNEGALATARSPVNRKPVPLISSDQTQRGGIQLLLIIRGFWGYCCVPDGRNWIVTSGVKKLVTNSSTQSSFSSQSWKWSKLSNKMLKMAKYSLVDNRSKCNSKFYPIMPNF